MLPARSVPYPDSDDHGFHPSVIDGTRPAIDIPGLLAMAAFFESCDLPDPIDSEPSPSIWDDALDVRIARL